MTGFSTPLFGVSWEPGTPDVDVARRVFDFLEDRRVLYAPEEAEVLAYALESVQRIRDFLTELLLAGGIDDELRDILRGMRAACRQFAEDVQPEPVRSMRIEPGQPPVVGPIEHVPPQWFVWAPALGKMRGVLGTHLGQLSVRYGIDVPEELVPLLPLVDEPLD